MSATAAAKDRLWSLPETAQFLGVPERTLYSWASRSTGPRSYRVGRFRRYKPSEVHAWLERQATGQSA
jgi:excisionase family DNA binding protein